jgi:hypothetical protein
MAVVTFVIPRVHRRVGPAVWLATNVGFRLAGIGHTGTPKPIFTADPNICDGTLRPQRRRCI